jgi:hypothetical protein
VYTSNLDLNGNNLTNVGCISNDIGPVTICDDLTVQGDIIAQGDIFSSQSIIMPTGEPVDTLKLLSVTQVVGVPTGAAPEGSLAYDTVGDDMYLRANGAWTQVHTDADASSLAQVLAIGNTTGANNIQVDNSQNVLFANQVWLDQTSSNGVIRIGYNTTAGNTGALLIGRNTSVTSLDGIAIGAGSTATGAGYNIALGRNASSTSVIGNAQSIAIGDTALANKRETLAVGYLASATGDDACGLGSRTIASASRTVALGRQATASGIESLAMGYLAVSSAGTSISIGRNSQAVGARQISIGQDAGSGSTVGINSVLIGFSADCANKQNCVVIGNSTLSQSNASVVIGDNALANGTQSNVAIGDRSTSGSTRSIAIGQQSVSSGASSVGIGYLATASGTSSVAVGVNSLATATGASALSPLASATHAYATVVGYEGESFGNKATVVTGAKDLATTGGDVFIVGGAGAGSVLSTAGAVHVLGSEIEIISDAETIFGGPVRFPGTDPVNTTNLLQVTRVNGVPTTTGVAGALAMNYNTGDLYYNNGTSWVILDTGTAPSSLATTLSVGNTTGGNDILISGGDSVEFAFDVSITSILSTSNIVVGYGNTASGKSVCVGNSCNATGTNSLCLGYNSNATGPNSIMIGTGTNSTANKALIACTGQIELDSSDFLVSSKRQRFSKQVVADATDGNTTLTAAQVLDRVHIRGWATNTVRQIALPSWAALNTELEGGFLADESFEFTLWNNNTAGFARVLTITSPATNIQRIGLSEVNNISINEATSITFMAHSNGSAVTWFVKNVQ